MTRLHFSTMPGRRSLAGRALVAATVLGSTAALLPFGGAALASSPTPVGAAAAAPADGALDDVRPAPGAFGTDIPTTYQGPAPSGVQKEFIGPHQLLRSGTVDQDKGTVTVPLYKGSTKGGRTVWYVLTDTSDRDEADSLGINFSPKLKYDTVGVSAVGADLVRGNALRFDNFSVDFRPERAVAPGAGSAAFPPASAQPGSVGSRTFSPIVKVRTTHTVYNAPVVSFGTSDAELDAMCDGNADHSKVHDKVVSICPRTGEVTLDLTVGFSFARPVLYLSTEANDETVAALEGATYAPGLKAVTVGGDDGAFSGVERIFIAANGAEGKDNPQRQGLSSAIKGEGDALNVLGGIPTIATDYSPLWDANLYEWTPEAIAKGYRARNFEEFRILGLAQEGHITGPGGAKFGSVGAIINCPPVFRLL